jgi:endoglucanase
MLREEAEARGIVWAYWEFGAAFGLYNRTTGHWHEEFLRALIANDD